MAQSQTHRTRQQLMNHPAKMSQTKQAPNSILVKCNDVECFRALCLRRMSQRLIISFLSQVAIMESVANQLMKSVVPYLDS